MSRQKDKGTAAETAVVRYSEEHGFKARRILEDGSSNPDVELTDQVVIQVKNHQTMSLAGWVDDATTQAEHYGAKYGVVWHKRKGKGRPKDWYVSMPGSTFLELIKELTNGAV